MADATVRTTSSKKPKSSGFYQQRLKAWQPILTPGWVTVTFVGVGLLFLLIGIGLKAESDSVVEVSTQYDGEGATGNCLITAQNANKVCTVSLTPSEDMKAPIYVYYQLENFYQNHRRYVKSRSDKQLAGTVLDLSALSDCDPLTQVTTGGVAKTLSPCGLIANSYFNDIIGQPPQVTSWSESDISWASDRESKFKNPTTRDTATYQYLDETYPSTAPKGVEDEHFIVWMRTAALPNFRKLYARIPDQDIKAGTTVEFNVTANFRVDTFKGKKFIVMSTTSWLGGKNDFLGIAYIVVGVVCMVLGGGFFVRYTTSGRVLGDPKYLQWRR